MGWRKRPPGEGGGYLEDIALGCSFWPVLTLIAVSVLMLFRLTDERGPKVRSQRVAGGSPPFPTQGGESERVRQSLWLEGRDLVCVKEDRWTSG